MKKKAKKKNEKREALFYFKAAHCFLALLLLKRSVLSFFHKHKHKETAGWLATLPQGKVTVCDCVGVCVCVWNVYLFGVELAFVFAFHGAWTKVYWFCAAPYLLEK